MTEPSSFFQPIELHDKANVKYHFRPFGYVKIPREVDFAEVHLLLIPDATCYWVLPAQLNEVFALGYASNALRNRTARYCGSLRKCNREERLLLINNGLLGKKAPITNLISLSDSIVFLEHIKKQVPPALRELVSTLK